MPDVEVTVSPNEVDVLVTPNVISIEVGEAGDVAVEAFNPTREAYLYSDFVADISPFGSSTGTAANASSGTITFDSSATQNVFGYATLRTNGTQGSRCGVFASYGTTTDVLRRTLVGYGAHDFSARLQFLASATTQRVIVGLGLSHGPAGANMLQYGAAFVAYGGAGNWIATTADNNVLSELDTGKSVNTWRTLRVTVNEDGDEYRFYIDGELLRTVTGTPFDQTVQLAWGVEVRDKAVGGSGATADALVDFMSYKYTIAR